MSRTEKPRKTKDGPGAIDAHVGARIRLRRSLLGMSQKDLGQQVGLTFQQIQKYERGTNRIGSGRLFEFSLILDVPISYFFDDLPPALSSAKARSAKQTDEAAMGPAVMAQRETLDLVRSFYRIEDATLRRRFLDLIRETAKLYKQAP